MRIQFSGVVTADEAADLARDVGYLDWDDERLGGILECVRGSAPVDLAWPSYARVEQRPHGHPWHTDAGNKHGGTRGWCSFSGGMLLVPPEQFTGGGLFFRDLPDNAVRHYRDLILWSSEDNEHRVAGNSGERVALILFFRETAK